MYQQVAKHLPHWQRLLGMDPDERFRDLYDATWRRVYGYARRHGDAHLAESVLQDTYEAAWRHLDRLPDEPIGWLITTAKRALIDHHRRVSRHDRIAAEVAAVAHLAADGSDVAGGVVDRHALVRALQQLAEDDREALLLIGWDGLSHAEAAHVTGLSRVGFTTRLNRARHRLTALLDPLPEPTLSRPGGLS